MEGKGFAPFLLFYKIVNDLITIYIHNRRLAYSSKLDFLVKKLKFTAVRAELRWFEAVQALPNKIDEACLFPFRHNLLLRIMPAMREKF